MIVRCWGEVDGERIDFLLSWTGRVTGRVISLGDPALSISRYGRKTIVAPKVMSSVRYRFDILRNRIQSFGLFFTHTIFDFLPKDTEGNYR